MKHSLISSIFHLVLLLIHFFSFVALARTHENFVQCLSDHQNPSLNTTSINPELICTPRNTSYFAVLNYSIRNPRFDSPTTPKPFVIITPSQVSHVQTTVICAKKQGIQIRIRSGGHDYEGLSYVSNVPFVILDLINMRSIDIDVQNRVAHIESGATLGEVYYRVAEKSPTLGFPAGVCHTIGIGGHLSGGGYGTMLRKYGLAADQVVDALVVNAEGQVLDRKSMGEDMFWAIRGGGGASYGVILSWKVRLVPVPPTVTVFTVKKNLSQNATHLVHRWQEVADNLHEDLFIRLNVQVVKSADQPRGKIIQFSFMSLFLGGIDRLIPLMREGFPDLGLRREDCEEMSWIESILYFDGLQGKPLEIMLDRSPDASPSFKSKSDYVTQPIPENGLEGIWEKLFELEVGRGILQMNPYGAKMNEISESDIPFPHRAGNIYKIQYLISWEPKANVTVAQTHIGWIRRLYSYMTPYVSKNPRSAYLNYRDLDVGTNNKKGTASYAQASIWGTKYFKNNFNRLVRVKTMVDPTNFFRNEQSIPSLSSVWKKIRH